MSQTELESAVAEVLVDEESLRTRVAELGEEISTDYAGRDLLLVGVLKGAVFFMADLMRQLTVPCEVDFMAISSYGAASDSSGVVRILKDLDIPIENRHVLVVEDIIDSGLTLSYLMRNLQARRPASLEVCALLTKPDRREIDVPVRYVGFEIPNRFVVGYGLDFAERYRNLPYVGVLQEDAGAGVTSRVRKPLYAAKVRITRRCYCATGRPAMNRFFRSGLLPLILIVLVVYLASTQLMSSSKNEKKVTLSQFQTYVQGGQVESAVFNPNKQSISFELTNGDEGLRALPERAVGARAHEAAPGAPASSTTRRESARRPGGRS